MKLIRYIKLEVEVADDFKLDPEKSMLLTKTVNNLVERLNLTCKTWFRKPFISFKFYGG